MMVLFSRYDVVVQIVMFVICWLMTILIWMSKPETTKQLKLCMSGLGLSIFAIAIHLRMLYETCIGEKFNHLYFNIAYIVFSILYAAILVVLITYFSCLSYEARIDFKKTHLMVNILFVIYLCMMSYPLLSNRLIVNENGMVVLTGWAETYLVCGIINTIILFFLAVKNRKGLTRVVLVGALLYVPLEIMAHMTQFFFPTLIISSCTYVMPFLLWYMLFHCPSYDEIVGSQSDQSIFALLDKDIKRNKKFLLFYVYYPQLEKKEFSDIMDAIAYSRAKTCRDVEKVKFGLRTYSRNNYTYMSYCRVRNDKQAEKIINGMNEILSRTIEVNGMSLSPGYKLLAIRNNELLNSSKKINSLIGYMLDRVNNNEQREYVFADEEILKDFEVYWRMEKEIYDIRSNMDLDDERVICYAQPIYNIETGEFRTAEALMRLKVCGKMYFPDQFIPVAERNDCIHVLTLIMLNKICKQIKEMEQEYDFDAITINCCTKELEDRKFAREIINLIKLNGVNLSKIRLEITESTEVSDFETISANIDELNEAGVRFYLDDFGTGYSNLERISSYSFMTIKFDKSMLYKAFEDPKADELLKILVDYFANNGLQTLVEGVEDESQRDYAKKRGFQYIQGYHYSRPVEVDDLREFFSKR